MATNTPEFISSVRKIRDITAPEVEANRITAEAKAGEAAVSAQTAVDKALEASESAITGQLSADEALLRMYEAQAEVMTATSYATEAEDVSVKEYTSVGNGTFTSVDTLLYSATHYSIKTNIDTTAMQAQLDDMQDTIAGLQTAVGSYIGTKTGTKVFEPIPNAWIQLPFDVTVASTDELVMVLNDGANTISLLRDLDYKFENILTLESVTDVQTTVNFRLVKVDNGEVLISNDLVVEIASGDITQLNIDGILTVGRDLVANAPFDVRVEMKCDTADYNLTDVSTIVSSGATYNLEDLYSKVEIDDMLAENKAISDAQIVVVENDILSTLDIAINAGQKNLIINGKKTIQQRGVTGGTKQVSEPVMNVGGNHTISFTGTATVTLYEFPVELDDYATTIADTGTNTLATAVASGTTVNTTVGYYIVAEFSSTDFNDVQLEKGSMATNFEVRHNESSLCKRTLQVFSDLRYYEYALSTYLNIPFIHEELIKTPLVENLTYSAVQGTESIIINANAKDGYITLSTGDATANTYGAYNISFILNADIFNTSETYKEDKWFI